MAITCRHLIPFLTASFLANVAFAAGDASTPGKLITASFTVFAQERLRNVYYRPRPDAGLERLESYTQTRSAVYAYRGPRELRFYDDSSVRLSPADAAAALPVAIATLPDGASRVLILFTPLEAPNGDRTKFAVKVIDDSLGTWPVGHVGILNAADRDYAVDVAGRRLQLPSGASECVPARGRTRVRFAAQFKGRWHRAGSHELDLAANTRACVVLFPPPNPSTISPQLRVLIEEFAEAEPGRARGK